MVSSGLSWCQLGIQFTILLHVHPWEMQTQQTKGRQRHFKIHFSPLQAPCTPCATGKMSSSIPDHFYPVTDPMQMCSFAARVDTRPVPEISDGSRDGLIRSLTITHDALFLMTRCSSSSNCSFPGSALKVPLNSALEAAVTCIGVQPHQQAHLVHLHCSLMPACPRTMLQSFKTFFPFPAFRKCAF